MPELRRSAGSAESMLQALRTFVHPVIVTEDEHRLLHSRGLGSKLPHGCAVGDKNARYQALGITLNV